MADSEPIPEVDVLIVGAGFGAFTMLNKWVPYLLHFSLYSPHPQDPQARQIGQDLRERLFLRRHLVLELLSWRSC
jgi:hypothetical protein